LANTDLRLGRADAAVDDIRRAIELDPVYAPAHWRLGLWLLDRNDGAGAERELTRAAELDPRAVAPAAGLALVYLRRGEEQRAIDRLEPALAANPGEGSLLHLLGTAYR